MICLIHDPMIIPNSESDSPNRRHLHAVCGTANAHITQNNTKTSTQAMFMNLHAPQNALFSGAAGGDRSQ